MSRYHSGGRTARPLRVVFGMAPASVAGGRSSLDEGGVAAAGGTAAGDGAGAGTGVGAGGGVGAGEGVGRPTMSSRRKAGLRRSTEIESTR